MFILVQNEMGGLKIVCPTTVEGLDGIKFFSQIQWPWAKAIRQTGAKVKCTLSSVIAGQKLSKCVAISKVFHEASDWLNEELKTCQILFFFV